MALVVSSGKNRTTTPAPPVSRKVTSGCAVHQHWQTDCRSCARQIRHEMNNVRRREIADLCDLMGQKRGNRP